MKAIKHKESCGVGNRIVPVCFYCVSVGAHAWNRNSLVLYSFVFLCVCLVVNLFLYILQESLHTELVMCWIHKHQIPEYATRSTLTETTKKQQNNKNKTSFTIDQKKTRTTTKIWLLSLVETDTIIFHSWSKRPIRTTMHCNHSCWWVVLGGAWFWFRVCSERGNSMAAIL